MKAYMALNVAAPAEVKRELPTILQFTRSGNEVNARKYAVMFLLAIAIQPGGAAQLYSSSDEISTLIDDADPGIERGALAVMNWVAAKGGQNQTYVSAMETAIQRPQTPQDTSLEMLMPLLRFGSDNARALKCVLNFMHRDDLTVATRTQMVHGLTNWLDLPVEVNQALVKELDDADARVRAAAVVAFADSANAAAVVAPADPATSYPILAKNRVEMMANDPQENAQVRELAREALRGRAGLNPNIDMPPVKTDNH